MTFIIEVFGLFIELLNEKVQQLNLRKKVLSFFLSIGVVENNINKTTICRGSKA
jgi:hypothetical protein